MDGKRGHATCGNQLAIERQESFQKFASLEEKISALLRPVGILQDFAWLDLGKHDSSSIKWKCFLKSTSDASHIFSIITCYALFLKSDWLVALLFLLK